MNQNPRLGNRIRASIIIGLSILAVAAYAADEKPLGPNVVARQGNAEVTLQDIDAAAAKIPEGDRAGFFDSPKRIESTISGLLYTKQLAAKSRDDKLDRDPLVKREIEQAIDDALARVELDTYKKNLHLPDFQMLAKEYYAGHQSDFVQSGVLILQDVVISTKDRSPQEAKARADEVEAAARANPDQFDALVEKYSDDPNKSATQGKGQRNLNKMAKPMAAAASAMALPGEISPVVETEPAFHVFKLIEKKADRQRPYEEIQTDLVLTLKRSFIATQLDQFTGEIRGKPLQANPDLVASLRTRYATTASDAVPTTPATDDAKSAGEQTPPAH